MPCCQHQTYGIDSTAKLWRATTPVDNTVDDSDAGRFRYSQRAEYHKSIVADQWDKAQRGREVDLGDHEDLAFFPDETREDDDDDSDHFLRVITRSRFSQDPYIGNDMVSVLFAACGIITTASSHEARLGPSPRLHRFPPISR